MDSLLAVIEQETAVKMVLVTVTADMVAGSDLGVWTHDWSGRWGIANQTTHYGIVVSIATELRSLYVANNNAVALLVTDGETRQIIDEVFIPFFKEKKFLKEHFQG